jgi:3-(3-hydroxy-phenyl)propionate hydroxylase
MTNTINNTTTVGLQTSVLVVGGGPVGLTLAALLAQYGVEVVVAEADSTYCTGSRAICISRRSQEIMGWIGADAAMSAVGLPWTGGRSYWRDKEVLHFQMPSDLDQRFAPMVNIQQFHVEAFAHEALKRITRTDPVLWQTQVLSVLPAQNGLQGKLEATLASSDGVITPLLADYVVACDGGKSTVRESLGLKLQGMQYDGQYIIVDIEQETLRPVERLAWFDPPSNPGSTILMHRQPGNVWRIDYQVRDDEDPAEAVKLENVLPRVQSHLDMIGETAPWKLLWLSNYNAKCLTLPNYRPPEGGGRVFFAGDAAHLVPIFGVRGLNSGLDDAGNLAWKLAAVIKNQIKGGAANRLLDSYSTERLHATHENLKYGAKSTEFMAPPHHGFRLMREAALRLSTVNPAASSLLNPRQSTPIEYVGSQLNLTAGSGLPAPEAKLDQGCGLGAPHLSALWGRHWTLLHFTNDLNNPKSTKSTKDTVQTAILSQSNAPQAWERYAAHEGLCVLIRPDGYIAGRFAALADVDFGAWSLLELGDE